MGHNIYSKSVTAAKTWHELLALKTSIDDEAHHLRNLITENDRINKFSTSIPGVLFDFSRQRIDDQILDTLIEFSKERKAKDLFRLMVSGEIVNTTEKTSTEHISTRSEFINVHSGKSLKTNEKSNFKELITFAEGVRSSTITGSTGKAFTDAVVIGIGGSHLGTAFAASSLKDYADGRIKLHFLTNIDYSTFIDLTNILDPETTLWIVISKSFTTSEVSCNSWIAWNYMLEKVSQPELHFVAISASEKASDSVAPSFREIFRMPEGVGGRYSVTSSAGLLPLSLYLGIENTVEMVKGAHEMDSHAENSPERQNLPMLAALVSIWNNCFLDYPALAIIPYSSRLNLLHTHIQQLYMESCGKSVTGNGDTLEVNSGVIIIGDTGTNAQHSFFQLIHQGRPFPVEFIGIARPFHEQRIKGFYGIPNHGELWINLISQAEALACGRESDDPSKRCPGNRPSSLIILDSISPANIGKLLAFYEARTVYEAFLCGYNPFDQFGVETGKIIASNLRQKLASDDKCRKNIKEITSYYLDRIKLGS